MSEVQSIKQRLGIIGDAPALNYAINVASQVAPTNLSVLITGESGTGKESFSRIIHMYSARKHNKFIAVNTGAIPEGTIDSELFGHEKGAFTGASDNRKGYFETVDGGTIFLDEIGEMPLGTQARLLRVLENGEFIKVGSSKVQKTDVRVVAATNVNLLEKVKKGKFREDLYYRLSTVPIEIPPLRERGNDVILLFRKFATEFAEKQRIRAIKLDESAKEELLKYSWPGNVRQLKNVAEQISVLAQNEVVNADELRSYIPKMNVTRLPALIDESNANGGNNFSEREIMYKMLFDIKSDVNDLKEFILQVTGRSEIPKSSGNVPTSEVSALPEHAVRIDQPSVEEYQPVRDDQPRILDPNEIDQSVHEVEELLSLADMEKEMIRKALEKYKGRRRKAAQELGISERTLYRKIKEYNIEE